MSENDIELKILKKHLTDTEIDQILQGLDVMTCEKCGVILSDDFAEHKICDECLYSYCINCIHVMVGEISCVCKDCSVASAKDK